MKTDFLSGWDFENEQADYNALRHFQEFCGEPFIVDWSEVRDRIYAEAELYNAWTVKSPLCDYTVAQTKTNGCVSYGVSAGIEDSLDMAKQKGKRVELLRSCAPWLYGGYHNLIKGRPGTGGCSMAGMMRFIAEYGILPYDLLPKIYADGEVDWNKNAKLWQQTFEKYSDTRLSSVPCRLPSFPGSFPVFLCHALQNFDTPDNHYRSLRHGIKRQRNQSRNCR